MIDWITGKFQCTHNPQALMAGRSIKTRVVNGVEKLEYEVTHRMSVSGSHDANITVRSLTDRTIEVSGNPVKFLQGHNVFGTSDLIYLVSRLFDTLSSIPELEICPTHTEHEMIQRGEYRLSRVDVNEHFLFPSEQVAKSWLRAAGSSANMRFRGAGLFKEGTLYFVPTSRRFVPKIYHKGDEITTNKKGHRLPEELLQIPELLDYAKNSLRFEIKILSTQLNDWQLHLGCNWSPETATMLIREQFIDKLQLSANMSLNPEILQTLPNSLKPVYALWESGQDLRECYSKAQFYKRRNQLLEYGIDISIVQDRAQELPNMVPMIRYLDAVPMGIPDWAYKRNLVA